MKNSQVSYILLLALNFWETSGTVRLDEFLKDVDEAHTELQMLGGMLAEGMRREKRSASIGELLARFDSGDGEADELDGGDAWYQSFRAMECQHGGCQKKPLRWLSKKTPPDDYYEYYEEAVDVKKFKDLKDQWEETANDLSHEANYKLSKVEQDAAEKSLPDTAWPVHRNTKRRLDPREAVELKTSRRTMRNGDGPSLPSAILSADREKITGEDIVSSQKRDDKVNPWKEGQEMREGRRLLSVEDSEHEGPGPLSVEDSVHEGCRLLSVEDSVGEERRLLSVEDSVGEGHSMLSVEDPVNEDKDTLAHTLDQQKFDNLKQRTSLEHHLGGLFANRQVGNVQYGKKKTLTNAQHGKQNALSDDLMRTEAFLKLQNYLKENQDNKTVPRVQKPSTVPLNLVEKDRDVNIKLHMSVNATVLGEDKLPEGFHRNNSITFQPSAHKTNDDNQSRDRRRVVFPIITEAPDGEMSKSVIEATEDFPLEEIITGRLTAQLVKTVFELVKTSPNLRVLWPGLMRSRVASPSEVQNFAAIRTNDNESEMRRTETMFRQAMEAINAIIEHQVRSRSCVPLRPDLQAFYNLIVQTQADNARCQERRKRESESDPPGAMSDAQIRKRSKIVKKLLRDYEELPREDQDQVASVKRNLLVAAKQLREMQQQSKRRKRQIMEYHFRDNHTSSETRDGLSPEYMKLAKTAELLLQNSFNDPDAPFSYI